MGVITSALAAYITYKIVGWMLANKIKEFTEIKFESIHEIVQFEG